MGKSLDWLIDWVSEAWLKGIMQTKIDTSLD